MKYLKKFETGEWNREIDWQFIKNNPDDDSEESIWIQHLENDLNIIINNLDNPSIFKIINIKGMDLYQGPYAIVKIFGKNYRIWESQLYKNELYIENFPITNNNKYSNPNYSGDNESISQLLNDINKCGDIELYKNSKKYNL